LPLFESDDLIETIGFSLIAISVALVVALILLGGFFSKRMWKPFFETIEAVGHYRATTGKPLKFNRSRTQEFAQLNAAIEEMTMKIDANFKQLRSFTENASHEIQTPVTAIRFEAELLLQNTALPEATLAAIHQIHQTASRLGKINESLLLLAKIGNNQFSNTDVNITLLLKEKIELFQDRIQLKNIAVDLQTDADVFVKSSPELAGIVVANLISNAIRHNIEGGKIEIKLSSNSLEIANTGEPLPFDEKQLFQRFVHNIEKHESNGLGLALVKEIADKNGWVVLYSYQQGKHRFVLNFAPEQVTV
jgi:signal transduction histidine kinase